MTSENNIPDIHDIFSKETIQFYKQNKTQITVELLSELRKYGNPGKQIAIDILDIEKDQEQYYLDAFGSRLSFMGNRRLKKCYSKLKLSPIHIEELTRCKDDIHYFKDNYVKIKTKSGVNFPDLRQYQNEFIDLLSDKDQESIIGYMGRQSSKSVSTSIYLSHICCFDSEKNIGIVGNKGAQAREFLSTTKSILIDLPIWMTPGINSWNKSYIELENDMRILTDVPTQDAFRGFQIHVAVIDEASWISNNRWDEFIDAFLPSQSSLAWKKNIILSTPKGMNHFYELVKGASDEFQTHSTGLKPPSSAHNGYTLFKVHWEDVPRYDSDGNIIKPEDFMNKIIKKHGIIYWQQNFGLEFSGSSYTLISSNVLNKMKHSIIEELKDSKLKIYKYPEKNHKYIMTVDAAKDGKDAFSIQIVDITDFHFSQVATANLQIDYLLMPEFIFDWCEYYNNPYLIIENNEGSGQSIADQMLLTYEYENIHFDKDQGRKKRKKYPGFRTTSKTRKQILQTMKLFIENNKLEINDKDTISQLFQFVLQNNKYQADEGAHDDLVMSLAMVFVPFCNTKNFEDMKKLVEQLYNKFPESQDQEKVKFSELLNIGCFDDGTDEEFLAVDKKYIQTSNGYIFEDL